MIDPPALSRRAEKRRSVADRAARSGVTHHAPSRLARRFHQICLGVLSEITQPLGLSPIQYGALGSLDIQPGIDQRGLAALMGIDTVSAHHMVEELEGSGLVARHIDSEDRRAGGPHLTPPRRGPVSPPPPPPPTGPTPPSPPPPPPDPRAGLRSLYSLAPPPPATTPPR